MDRTAATTARKPLGMFLGLCIFLALGVFWFGAGMITWPMLWLLSNSWVIPTLVMLVLAVVAMSVAQPTPSKKGKTRKDKKIPDEETEKQNLKKPSKAFWLAVWGTVVCAGVSILLLFVAPYWQANRYAGSIQESTTHIDYQYRAPFVVAEQLANRDLDQVIGDRVGAHAVQTAERPGQYTSLVVRRGFMQGYEAVQVIQPPLVGSQSSTSTACLMDTSHTLKLDGWTPWNDLGRAISFQRPLSWWNEKDVYGLCAGETPVVVVPLTTLDGFWPLLTERPDGVAVYTGGEVTIHAADAIPADLPGPTYPRSLAAAQRESSLASGGFWDYWFNRVGYDTAGAGADDPNAENAADFSLVNDAGQPHYVTPLTPVGSSESLVALSQVSSRQSGIQLNPVHVFSYAQPRPALSTSENRIRSDFSDLPGWASGMRVMEITPAAKDTYVASIGQNQVVTYRMLIASDGSVSILDKAGGAPTGNAPASPEEDTSQLSTEELQRRIKAYTDELVKRVK